jgi:hypothetical protein
MRVWTISLVYVKCSKQREYVLPKLHSRKETRSYESNHIFFDSTLSSSLSLHCAKRSNPSLTKSPPVLPTSSRYHRTTSKSLRAANKASRRNATCRKVDSHPRPRAGHPRLGANPKAVHCGVVWRGPALPRRAMQQHPRQRSWGDSSRRKNGSSLQLIDWSYRARRSKGSCEKVWLRSKCSGVTSQDKNICYHEKRLACQELLVPMGLLPDLYLGHFDRTHFADAGQKNTNPEASDYLSLSINASHARYILKNPVLIAGLHSGKVSDDNQRFFGLTQSP